MAAVLYVRITKSDKLLVENRNSSSRIQTRHAKKFADPDGSLSISMYGGSESDSGPDIFLPRK